MTTGKIIAKKCISFYIILKVAGLFNREISDFFK